MFFAVKDVHYTISWIILVYLWINFNSIIRPGWSFWTLSYMTIAGIKFLIIEVPQLLYMLLIVASKVYDNKIFLMSHGLLLLIVHFCPLALAQVVNCQIVIPGFLIFESFLARIIIKWYLHLVLWNRQWSSFPQSHQQCNNCSFSFSKHTSITLHNQCGTLPSRGFSFF